MMPSSDRWRRTCRSCHHRRIHSRKTEKTGPALLQKTLPLSWQKDSDTPWTYPLKQKALISTLFSDPRYVSEALKEAVKPGYGSYPKNGIRVVLEHTSANPNGPLHVGHIRNSIIGDTLARVFRKAGYRLEVQYYVNDMGRQIAIVVWGFDNLDSIPMAGEKEDAHIARVYIAANREIEKDPGHNPAGQHPDAAGGKWRSRRRSGNSGGRSPAALTVSRSRWRISTWCMTGSSGRATSSATDTRSGSLPNSTETPAGTGRRNTCTRSLGIRVRE